MRSRPDELSVAVGPLPVDVVGLPLGSRLDGEIDGDVETEVDEHLPGCSYRVGDDLLVGDRERIDSLRGEPACPRIVVLPNAPNAGVDLLEVEPRLAPRGSGARARRVEYPRTFRELEGWFPDELTCLAYLARLRWPDGFVCPRCRAREAWKLSRGLWRCACCRTILAATRLPLKTWFAVVW